MLFLAFLIGSRGFTPQVIVEISIWCLGAYYFVSDKIIDKINLNNKWLFSYFICFILFALSVSIAGDLSSLSVFYYFIILLPFLSIFSNYDRVQLFVKFSSYFVSVISLLIILHFLNIINFDELINQRSGISRAKGLMGNPNYYAYYCFVIFIASFFMEFKFKKLSLFLIAIAIVFSISRGVIISLVLFGLINSIRSPKRLIFSIVLAFLFIQNISLIFPDSFVTTFITRISELTDEEGAGSGRSTIWAIGFKRWSENWFQIIFGFGFNQFATKLENDGLINTVHNSYLRALFELGLVGLIILSVFYKNITSSIKWPDFRTMLTVILPILLSWMSNDFFILKETFYLIAILISIFHAKGNDLLNSKI